MAAAKRVTIVVPTYNGARFLRETVEAVQRQTHTTWSLLLVDDASTDDTLAVASACADADERIRVVRHSGGNVAGTRNRGRQEAAADTAYFLFLDQDDVPEPTALETLIAAIEADPRYAAAHGVARFIDASGQPIRTGDLERDIRQRVALIDGRIQPWPAERPTTFAVEIVLNRVVNGSILIRADALKAVGPFDPEAVPADDYDMWLRLSLHGDIAFADRLVLNYRLHESNASRNNQAMVRSDEYVRHKFMAAPEFSDEVHSLARRAYRHKHTTAAGLRLRWCRSALVHGRVRDAAVNLGHVVKHCKMAYS